MGRTYTKIGLLDHLGGGNLGDDATLDAVMQNIKSRWPEAAIFAFCLNPRDTETRHRVPSYPIRTKTWDLGASSAPPKASLKESVKAAMSKYGVLFRLIRAIHMVLVRFPRALVQEFLFLAKSFNIIRSFDLLVISGGGQLTDWGGPWLFPYTIFKWIALAKVANVKRIFLNVGAGPLARPLSRFFVRRALHSASYVSFRDLESRTLVEKIGFGGRAEVYPDCVYGQLTCSHTPREFRRSDRRKVGIAPMPYFDPRSIYPDKDKGAYDGFIQTLASLGCWLVREGYALNLFCSDIGIDPPVIEELESKLLSDRHTDRRLVTTASVKSTTDLLSTISSMDYVITCRFHGVVFAHILNKPVLAISHHPKVANLMEDMGMSKYCIDIRTCSIATLTSAFLSLVANEDAIKSQMAHKLAHYRRQLKNQFDSVFPAQRALATRVSRELTVQ